MVDFFTNLGKTVTTFPKDVQIRVKGAVFKIVNDAEADLFCRQGDTNNISHASRESQNMQTINQQTVAAVILSQNNQFSSIQPLRTSGHHYHHHFKHHLLRHRCYLTRHNKYMKDKFMKYKNKMYKVLKSWNNFCIFQKINNCYCIMLIGNY